MMDAPLLPPPGRPQRERPAQTAAPLPQPPESAPTPLPAHLRPVPGLPGRRPSAPPTTNVEKRVTPAQEVAFATVEAEMGGRQKFVSTLSTAQLPVEVERVLGAIADPANDKLSLARICALHDVSLPKLLDVFKAALMARGKLQAHVKIASRLPDVAAAVMDDAVAEDRVCGTCLGARTMPAPTPEDPDATKSCGTCKGRGVVRHQPDHEVQKTALKIGGLLETGRGVSIAVNQQTLHMGGAADSASYDTLIAALDGALYGRGRERLDGHAGQVEQTARAEQALDGEWTDPTSAGDARDDA